MPQTRPRKPRRSDDEDLFEAFAGVFAVLPPWPVPRPGDRRCRRGPRFRSLHLNVVWRPAAQMIVTCFSGIAGLRERVARRGRLNTATSLDALRALSWREFEHLVLAAYAKQGWSASLTQR